jgi:hypothetical protein
MNTSMDDDRNFEIFFMALDLKGLQLVHSKPTPPRDFSKFKLLKIVKLFIIGEPWHLLVPGLTTLATNRANFLVTAGGEQGWPLGSP